jgi:hypothetical protein
MPSEINDLAITDGIEDFIVGDHPDSCIIKDSSLISDILNNYTFIDSEIDYIIMTTDTIGFAKRESGETGIVGIYSTDELEDIRIEDDNVIIELPNTSYKISDISFYQTIQDTIYEKHIIELIK